MAATYPVDTENLRLDAHDIAMLGTALGVGGANPILQAVVELSSAQILALHSSPVTIIPAPGAGKYIQCLGFACSLTFGTVAYVDPSGDNICGLYYGTNIVDGVISADSVLLNALIQETSNKITFANGAPTNTQTVSRAGVENLPIVASDDTNPTTGDGTIRIVVTYCINPI